MQFESVLLLFFSSFSTFFFFSLFFSFFLSFFLFFCLGLSFCLKQILYYYILQYSSAHYIVTDKESKQLKWFITQNLTQVLQLNVLSFVFFIKVSFMDFMWCFCLLEDPIINNWGKIQSKIFKIQFQNLRLVPFKIDLESRKKILYNWILC